MTKRSQTAVLSLAVAAMMAMQGLVTTYQAWAQTSTAKGQQIVVGTKFGWEAGRKFRDCPDCPQMVVVPPGSYEMGSPSQEQGRGDHEGPVRLVDIAYAFAVGVHEVTFREWDTCRHEGGCSRFPLYSWGRGTRPVVNVSWKDAKEFVRWLSRRTEAKYRLLSESEWEYVARAGTKGPFHFGSTISSDQANYNAKYTYGAGSQGRNRKRTEPVGSFPENAFGLHEVHGNVWEWVEDCWHESYVGAPSDGSAWTVGGDCRRRVLRGGSWDELPKDLRSAARNRYAGPCAKRPDARCTAPHGEGAVRPRPAVYTGPPPPRTGADTRQ